MGSNIASADCLGLDDAFCGQRAWDYYIAFVDQIFLLELQSNLPNIASAGCLGLDGTFCGQRAWDYYTAFVN